MWGELSYEFGASCLGASCLLERVICNSDDSGTSRPLTNSAPSKLGP